MVENPPNREARIRSSLVTGASGFIGSRLCQRLQAQGVKVRGLMRCAGSGPWEQSVEIDLAESDVPVELMSGVDTVFHLAGRAHALDEIGQEERVYERVNVEGTRRVVDAAIAAGVHRFVFFSSVKAMGEGGDACIDEDFDAMPETVYGRSKLEAERLVAEAGRRHGMRTVSLRLAMVYGPGHKGNLARMLEAVAAGRFPPLPEFGNRRSMVHVDDVVEAALLAATRPEAAGKTYIVAGGEAYSTRRIYELMCEALGRRPARVTAPVGLLRAGAAMGDVIGRARGRRFVFDSDALAKLSESAWYSSDRIERELGFRARRTLEDALPEMVAELGLGGGSARKRGALKG